MKEIIKFLEQMNKPEMSLAVRRLIEEKRQLQSDLEYEREVSGIFKSQFLELTKPNWFERLLGWK